MCFTLHREESHLAARIIQLLARFGVAAIAYDRLDRHSCEIKAASTPLAHLLVSLIGKGARNKRIPAQILTGPLGVRQGFLEGILDGDGKNPSRETNPTGRRDLKTASRSLAWGVRTLLADIGHWASISTGESPSVFPWGTSPRPYRWYILSELETVGIRAPEDEQFLYRPILSVDPVLLDTEVFNFEVEEDNSYVSDFVLHNEAYLAPGSRFEKQRRDVAEPYSHLTLLAQNETGYATCVRLVSRASWRASSTALASTRSCSPARRGDDRLSGCMAGEVTSACSRATSTGAAS